MPDAAHRPSPRGRGGEPARLVALPGGQSGRPGRTPIPSTVGSFVGREDELSEIIRLLHTHRLVTLTGAGGSGKTRLALAAAGELTEIFHIEDLSLVLQQLILLSETCRVRDKGNGPLESLRIRWL